MNNDDSERIGKLGEALLDAIASAQEAEDDLVREAPDAYQAMVDAKSRVARARLDFETALRTSSVEQVRVQGLPEPISVIRQTYPDHRHEEFVKAAREAEDVMRLVDAGILTIRVVSQPAMPDSDMARYGQYLQRKTKAPEVRYPTELKKRL
ncbi:hypothetical protein EBT31_00105 [bacterium]|nr:hypothetical protein [bacterium]